MSIAAITSITNGSRRRQRLSNSFPADEEDDDRIIVDKALVGWLGGEYEGNVTRKLGMRRMVD
jgi:hypothetical protein